MHAFRKPSPLAAQLESSGDEPQSPEQNASAMSGTSVRAVRPTDSEAAALAQGGTLIDCAKVEGLRFELEVGIWRGDPERIARNVIEDGEYLADGVTEDE